MDGKRPEHLQLTAAQMRDPSVLGKCDLLNTFCNFHDILHFRCQNRRNHKSFPNREGLQISCQGWQ